MQHVHTHVAIGHERKGNTDHRYQPVEMPLDFIELWKVLVQHVAEGNLRYDCKDEQDVGPHDHQTDAFDSTVERIGNRLNVAVGVFLERFIDFDGIIGRMDIIRHGSSS